jgi:hypothetical protein
METKAEKFHRLRDARLPKAVHAITLMGNLSGPNYEWTPQEAEKLIGELRDAVEDVAKEYGVGAPTTPVPESQGATSPEPPHPKTQRVSAPADVETVSDQFIVDGGATALSEIRWAYDAIRRGDHKLAANRLHRILTAKNG